MPKPSPYTTCKGLVAYQESLHAGRRISGQHGGPWSKAVPYLKRYLRVTEAADSGYPSATPQGDDQTQRKEKAPQLIADYSCSLSIGAYDDRAGETAAYGEYPCLSSGITQNAVRSICRFHVHAYQIGSGHERQAGIC